MNQIDSIAAAEEIMLDFARLTGLSPASDHPKRYLWTDAFAACNYLELFRITADKAYLDLALRLVQQVHDTLGRHRPGDPRSGWISGLDDEEGERHPTIGGLRIGKRLNERMPGDRYDDRLEWDQDGQYYHYLTKWMHALNRASQTTKDPAYLRWAIELAQTAHARFTYYPRPGSSAGKRMYWKMSIDLTRPLVPSMGQHDPLDGLVTYSELQAAAGSFGEQCLPDLSREIGDMAGICRGVAENMATDDPLGIGGLLFDACRISQLIVRGFKYEGLMGIVISSALMGMEAFAGSGMLEYPADYRLAFRELGLSIGLSGVERLQRMADENPGVLRRGNTDRQAKALLGYMPLGERIEQFWMDGRNREAASWTEHREINMVMLATSFHPGEFLMI